MELPSPLTQGHWVEIFFKGHSCQIKKNGVSEFVSPNCGSIYFFCATFSTLGQAASGKSRAQAMEKLFQFENLRLDFRSLSIALSTANITKVI